MYLVGVLDGPWSRALAAALAYGDESLLSRESGVALWGIRPQTQACTLNEQFSRYPAHRGVRALKEATTPEPRLTRSEAERRLLELIRAAGLPEPLTNTRVAGYEVDFLWPDQGLIVEVDGYPFHSHCSSFERDRRRDAALTLAGYRVIRITWRQLTEAPERVIAVLAAALAAQPEALRSSTVSA